MSTPLPSEFSRPDLTTAETARGVNPTALGLDDGDIVLCLGLASVLDGRGGPFRYGRSSAATADGIDVVVPLGGIGRLLRIGIADSAAPVSSIPATVPTRTGDVAIGANLAQGFPATVGKTTRVRRARLRVGATSTGKLCAGAFDPATGARLTTSGEVSVAPIGAMEFALPPTDIQSGTVEVWISASEGTVTAGNNSTYGDLVGAKAKTGGHPLPATMTGAVGAISAWCVSLLPDDPVGLNPAYPYAREDMGVAVAGKNPSSGRLYGTNLTTGHWNYSDDNGATWVSVGVSPSAGNPGGIFQLVFHGAFWFAFDLAGKIWRNTIETYTGWTDVSVAAAPAGTTGRPDILASNGTFLYYGNYTNGRVTGGSFIWRSADNGATWTQVLNVTTAKHVHSIIVDPSLSTRILANLGDSPDVGVGLYVSSDSGATWTLVSGNRYGINMTVPTAVSGTPQRVLMEGDGPAGTPHLFSYYYSKLGDTSGTILTDPLVWPDQNPKDGRGAWNGTVRGLAPTSEGNVFWFSTPESGAVGTRAGVWIARGPWYTTPVLLQELTGAEPVAYSKTFESGAYLINYRHRYLKPRFYGQ